MNCSLNTDMPIRYHYFHTINCHINSCYKNICSKGISTPKKLNLKKQQNKQQGSSIVLALFIIIVLSLLGGVLMKMISTSSETVSQEVLGTRAYMAANSAMQAQLQKLFPLNATGSCNSEPYDLQTTSSEYVPGLYDCQASTSCETYFTNPENSAQYYRLTSTGTCGSGTMAEDSKVLVTSSRTIQVEARSL